MSGQNLVLEVRGMHCAGCVDSVHNAFTRSGGIREAIKDAGFDAPPP